MQERLSQSWEMDIDGTSGHCRVFFLARGAFARWVSQDGRMIHAEVFVPEDDGDIIGLPALRATVEAAIRDAARRAAQDSPGDV